MLYDPGVWLFGLAVALFLAGVLGVVLSTRRVPPSEALGMPGIITDPGSQRQLLELEAEVERLRAERDELRLVLSRLAALMERRAPQLSAERRAHLVATGDDGEHRAGGD
jgi:alkylation response protein AidB-like acyl-CoA dehydrogenase